MQQRASDPARPVPDEGAGTSAPVRRRVLAVLTRDVGQRTTGRIVVLRTHLAALADLGHEVTVAVVAPAAPTDTPWTRRFPTVHIRSPRPLSVGFSVIQAFARRGRSLNEALFVNRRVREQVTSLARQVRADVVLLDSLRLSTALRPGVAPTVVDLDDLLSTRYAALRSTARLDPVTVLGFAAGHIPAAVRPLVARGAVRLLGWEHRRVARRELEIAAAAAAVSLVSRVEVDQLAGRSGRAVVWLPPSVPVPAEPAEPGPGLVFLGGLDYLPNLEALRTYRDQVLPHLDPADPEQVLHVVGHCPPAARAELAVPGIVLHGFVDDLREALRRRLLVAPLVRGGGVKLKVLDALAHGLPVAGTEGAFEGLGLPADLRLQAANGPDLAALVRRLIADPQLCRSLGLRGRAFVEEQFSSPAAVRRWDALLGRLGS